MATKRKNKGEGSVFRVSDGKWRAKVIYKGHSRSRRAETKAEAQDLLKIIKKELVREEKIRRSELRNSGLKTQSSTTTVFNEFLKFKKYGPKCIKPTSYQRLESIINTHILPRLGKIICYNIRNEVWI